MQLCAIDKNEQLILASTAERHIDYQCIECQQVVRVRKGFHRQAHYYHLQPNTACRLSGKSLIHITVQNKILELLPKDEAEMECRFPEIGRIADVAWDRQKIIFEVQCASITAKEVLERNINYKSLGYDVVWILHTNRYNKVRMTSAEDVLHNQAHYFTDIDTLGNGGIFDQYSRVVFGKRLWRFPKYPIDISKPYTLSKEMKINNISPKKFKSRYTHWPKGFYNDYLDRCLNERWDNDLLTCFRRLKEEVEEFDGDTLLTVLAKRIYKRWIIYPYQVLFRHILEKASR